MASSMVILGLKSSAKVTSEFIMEKVCQANIFFLHLTVKVAIKIVRCMKHNVLMTVWSDLIHLIRFFVVFSLSRLVLAKSGNFKVKNFCYTLLSCLC